MSTRTFVAVGAALVALGCSADVPTTPPQRATSAGTEAQSARRAPAPSSGTLAVCKAAGAGLPAGESFAFQVTLSGVTRTVTVTAGSCVQLEVPRESAPQKKGYFRSAPAEVTRLLPGTTTLRVDDADLTSTDAQAILAESPNVSASSSLLLNLVQQLIAADLNVLRGVQASAPVLQAIADANAGVAITTGAPMVITTALSAPDLSAITDVLTAFNEGKTKPPAAPPSATLDVVETIGPLVELTSIACDPAARCTGADPSGGSVAATVESGATTTVTFTNRSKPVLRVCKVAGTGIDAGRVFSFGAGGIDVTSSAQLDVAAGECEDAVLLEGNYEVAESGPIAGVAVSSIVCDPAERCSNISVGLGALHVAIVRGITTVTFTNRSTLGTLRFCKVAGAGIAAGTTFGMAAGGINLNPNPGEPVTASVDVPAGECGDATLLEGSYEAGEPNSGVGVTVSAMTCDPADRCSNISLGLGTLHAQVVGASTTTITVTNRVTLGTMRFCKLAGAGITAGREFHMSAGGINLLGKIGEPVSGSADVPAGECRDVTLLEGQYEAAEASYAGVRVSDISCDPADRCSNISTGIAALHAQIVGASTTTVTFTNRSAFATLRACVVAGAGVTPGTVFHVGAGGINLIGNSGEPTAAGLDIPAGECREATLLEGNYEVAEGGPLPDGMTVSAIACDPSDRCFDVSLGVGAVKATLVGASVTQVTFTNSVAAGALIRTAPLPVRSP